jgi:hypothetical protein
MRVLNWVVTLVKINKVIEKSKAKGDLVSGRLYGKV